MCCIFSAVVVNLYLCLLSSLDLDEMESISAFRKRCIIPVLGLIENSLYENSLVHNILCMLLQLLNACPKLADILLDHGLLYVLFNTLSTLNGMETRYCSTNTGSLFPVVSGSFCLLTYFILLSSSFLCSIPLNDYKLLVCDIQQLLVAVTIHSCSSSGSQYFRIIEDLITLLGFMQTSKMRRTQGESRLLVGSYMCTINQRCHLLSSLPLAWYNAVRLCCGNITVTSLSTTAQWKLFEKNIWTKSYLTSSSSHLMTFTNVLLN